MIAQTLISLRNDSASLNPNFKKSPAAFLPHSPMHSSLAPAPSPTPPHPTEEFIDYKNAASNLHYISAYA